MTILFRYLSRELLKVFVICLSGLMTIYLVVDFFEKVRKFIRYDASFVTMLEYFALRVPAISFQIAPLAVLMATLLTVGMFSKNHEITAMRSCGISLLRIAMPFLAFSTVLALVLFVLSAVVVPHTTTKSEHVRITKIEKRAAGPTFKTGRSWIPIGNRSLMNFEFVDPDGTILRGINLYQLSQDFRLTVITEAQEARYTPQGWILPVGVRRTLLPDGTVQVQTVSQEPIPLSETPEDFTAWLSTETEIMPLADLWAYAQRLQRDGYNVARFLTDYHGRIAFPFVSVIMTTVGIALSLRRSGIRGSGMAMGIGQALAIGFLYWATHSVAIALGRGGALTPPLAGWLSNVLFLSLGFSLYLQVRH